jgi:hypothetical protein
MGGGTRAEETLLFGEVSSRFAKGIGWKELNTVNSKINDPLRKNFAKFFHAIRGSVNETNINQGG